MKESIGSTFIINMVIVFIAIVFAILAAILTYYKAFKVNTRIINSIEKYEGYNSLALHEIDNTLTSIGYTLRTDQTCPSTKDGGVLQTEDKKFRYCVYYFEENDRYYSYGVITYVTLDIPIVNMLLHVPIYTKSNRIFRFNG